MEYVARKFLSGNENRPSNVGLSDNNRAYVKKLGFTQKHYPAHTTIVSFGENCDRVFLIESGWGCISHDLVGGQRQILDFAIKGDIVLPLSSAGGALETFAAETDLSVLEASMKAIMANAATAAQDFLALFLEGLSRQRALLAQHLTNIGRRTASQRTAHLFLELTARLQCVGLAPRDVYECPLTQYDLADALGLTPIHVNRMLRELRERNFLEFRQGRVRIIDKPGLIRFAGFHGGYLDA